MKLCRLRRTFWHMGRLIRAHSGKVKPPKGDRWMRGQNVLRRSK